MGNASLQQYHGSSLAQSCLQVATTRCFRGKCKHFGSDQTQDNHYWILQQMNKSSVDTTPPLSTFGMFRIIHLLRIFIFKNAPEIISAHYRLTNFLLYAPILNIPRASSSWWIVEVLLYVRGEEKQDFKCNLIWKQKAHCVALIQRFF